MARRGARARGRGASAYEANAVDATGSDFSSSALVRGLADCEGNWDERHRDAFNERFEAQGDRTRPRRGVHLYATD